MKKAFNLLMTLAAAAFVFIACSKETNYSVAENYDNQLVQVTITAGNPVVSQTSRTEMVGSQPYWSVGDAIGVSNGTSTNYKFNTGIEARATSASFTGTTAVSSTLYAYYPYTSNGVGQIQDTQHNGAKVDLPNNQNPTATSFDGKADVMVAKQFSVDPENTTVKDLEFTRLGAIVKIVLIDQDGTMTGTQHPATVSMTAESALAGRVLIDMENQNLDAPYYNATSSVTANYTSETKYAIDGSNATYLIVYPQTLAEGSTLTIAASTENYSLSKAITVPTGGIELQPGKVTTLNVRFAAANITSDAGAALPFEDDMAWADNGGSDGNTNIASSVESNSNGLYTSAVYLYKGIGGAKLGSSSNAGSITTKELDLSGAFYITIEAGQFGSDTGNIVVTIDGEDPVIETNDFTDILYANISAGTYTNKSKVTIKTSSKRARIYSVEIKTGTYVPAPKSITFSQPASGGSFTVKVDDNSIASDTQVAAGKTVTLTATAATGYAFNEWTVSGATVVDAYASTTTFVMGTSAVTVSASFISNSSKTYEYTISTSDFTATGYGKEMSDIIATATDGSGATISVSHETNNAGLQSGKIQFKKNVGMLYNTTDLGTVVSVTLNGASGGTGTIYMGSSQNPTTSGSGGYFTIKETANATLTCTSIIVRFTK